MLIFFQELEKIRLTSRKVSKLHRKLQQAKEYEQTTQITREVVYMYHK